MQSTSNDNNEVNNLVAQGFTRLSYKFYNIESNLKKLFYCYFYYRIQAIKFLYEKSLKKEKGKLRDNDIDNISKWRTSVKIKNT